MHSLIFFLFFSDQLIHADLIQRGDVLQVCDILCLPGVPKKLLSLI